MTTSTPRGFLTIILSLVLLVATQVDGQTNDPLSVVVPPFSMSMGPNLGRAIAAEVTTLIEDLPTHRAVDWAAFLDASPQTREFDEERRAELGCIGARQLAQLNKVDIVLCGEVQALRTGFEVELVVIRAASGEECWLGTAAVENRSSAVRYVMARFEGWALGEAICYDK